MLALLLQAVPALPKPIGRQPLPAKGCAAYLWSRGPAPALVAMATTEPAGLRIAIDGPPAVFALAARGGEEAGFGFDRSAAYRQDATTVRLELTLAVRPDLSQGAIVTDGTLTVERAGGDTAVLPVGGLVGCAISG